MRRLSTTEPDFERRLAELLAFESAQDPRVDTTVAAILADVKKRGDTAVLEYTARFDGVKADTLAALEIPKFELQAALARIPATRRTALEAAAERVREGAPIGRSLAVGALFPPMTVHLISSGESSGRLEEMLERAAANQERELDGLLTALVGLLGPLLIVGMGIFVLVIVFAMLMPIFEMNTLVR